MKTSSSMSQMKLQHEYTNFAEIYCTLYMFRNHTDTWTTGQFYSQVCFRGLVWEYLKNSSCSVKLSWFYSSVCLYSILCRFWPLSCKLHSSVLPFIFTLDFPKLSLIRWSSYVTMDGWWSGRMWKMNLSHQEQGLLPLRRGSHPLPPWQVWWISTCHVLRTQILRFYPNTPLLCQVRDAVGNFTNESCDISTLTLVQLDLTSCSCGLSLYSKSTESRGGEVHCAYMHVTYS